MSEKPSRATFRTRLDETVNTLRDEILTGKRSVGEYLPSEIVLADQFQLSRNSIRKGLDILVSEGYIEKVPRIGNRVTRPLTEGVTTIKFGYHLSVIKEAEIHELIADFHKLYPHIRVQAFVLPYSGYHAVVQEYMQNDMLDVVTMNNTEYQGFIEDDRADLFEPFETDPELYPFLSRQIDGKGTSFLKPFIFSPVVLCYNRDHFREKGLAEPDSGWNWKDLLDVAVKLADGTDRYSFYFHLLSNNRWPVFLLQSGVRFERNGSGKYGICRSRLMDSLVACRNIIYHQGIFPNFISENDADAEELFLQKKVSMIMTTYLNMNLLQKADFAFDVAPLPFLNDAKSLLLIIGLAMNRNTREKGAAKTLVDYLLSYPAQLKIRQKTLSLPSRKIAAEWMGKELFYRPSRFHMYREIIPSFRLISELHLSITELETLNRELRLFWSRMEDEESVCRRLEALM
jgi:multiple sugar transport system substrate-binding protein